MVAITIRLRILKLASPDSADTFLYLLQSALHSANVALDTEIVDASRLPGGCLELLQLLTELGEFPL